MLPEQLPVNTPVLDYFESVSFLCLRVQRRSSPYAVATAARGRERYAKRIEEAVDRWSRFNDALTDAARSADNVQAIDATRSVGEVESDVREWLLARLQGWP